MKKLLPAVTLGALVSVCACMTSCGTSQNKSYNRIYYHMGTEAMFVCGEDVEEEEFEKVSDEIEILLTEAENSLSIRDKNSYISAFNACAAGGKVQLNKTAYDVLKCAMDAYTFTEGAYNPAVYYSVRDYGFEDKSYKNKDFVPPDGGSEKLKAYASLSTHFAEIVLSEEEGKYYAVKPETSVVVGDETLSLKIDLGGIGKGWCTDRVDEILEAHEIKYGYFNFGLSSLDFKKYKSGTTENYILSARDPRSEDDTSYFRIYLHDTKLSTSGDYEQYYEIDGVRYCHIIDPFTASPIKTGISSVTVVGGSAAENDALTTALSVMGKDKAVEFINKNLTDKNVVLLYHEGDNGWIITNSPHDIVILNMSYKLANYIEDGKIVFEEEYVD